MIAQRDDKPADARPASFGSRKPMIDALIEAKALRESLGRYVECVEKALSAVPEPGVSHSLHDINEGKRLALGGLGMRLSAIMLILESDPADATARKALSLLSDHGTSDEMQMAAKVLLARCGGPGPMTEGKGHDDGSGVSP